MLAAAPPSAHFFPNLRTIYWTVNQPAWFPYVRLFLCPSIKTLMIGMFATTAHLTLLRRLSTQCPLLESCIAQRSKLICELTHLKTLNVHNLDQPAFAYLAQLPSLTALAVSGVPEFLPSRITMDPPPFSNLRSVAFGSATHEFTTAFIAMNSWSLIAFRSSIISVPTAAQTAELYAMLASKCSHKTLAQLHLGGGARFDIQPLHPLEAYAVQSDALRSLGCFQNLQEVTLVPPGGFDIDDAMVEDLARAWPRIFSLQLGGSYRSPSSRVTLHSLRALAAHCPNLGFLSLVFDASIVPDVPPERGALFRLDVSDSVLGDLHPSGGSNNETPAAVAVHARAIGLHKLWKAVMALRPEHAQAGEL
ncbi:hypothetical protein B0H17DRAFT_1197640 [Mycena rosella]|uniref:Uncharacterized protein n=1 Tax=Mycena rosella TaxID=1033263 RepID=A0AAD7GP87_MYCRO|nr:hypothetical protein B0H17DRAFT_1197640 [Mycena rosella]